jgi:electron transport complex protein RnfB
MNPLMQAHIREQDCIGCTKCIQACPYDAIMGAAKLMHTVLMDECTGCGDCVAPCPVDCIDLIPREIYSKQQPHEHDLVSVNTSAKTFDPLKAEARRIARLKRLEQESDLQSQQHSSAKTLKNTHEEDALSAKKSYILEAIKRAQLKKKMDFKRN